LLAGLADGCTIFGLDALDIFMYAAAVAFIIILGILLVSFFHVSLQGPMMTRLQKTLGRAMGPFFLSGLFSAKKYSNHCSGQWQAAPGGNRREYPWC